MRMMGLAALHACRGHTSGSANLKSRKKGQHLAWAKSEQAVCGGHRRHRHDHELATLPRPWDGGVIHTWGARQGRRADCRPCQLTGQYPTLGNAGEEAQSVGPADVLEKGGGGSGKSRNRIHGDCSQPSPKL